MTLRKSRHSPFLRRGVDSEISKILAKIALKVKVKG